MCTMIADKTPVSGSAKGPAGWFTIDHVYVGYDHAAHTPLEHALSLDFVDESSGPGARVAVELTRESAHALLEQLRRTLAAADQHEDA